MAQIRGHTTAREDLIINKHKQAVKFPYGNQKGQALPVIKTMEDLSHLIKTQRKRAGLSQADFAGASGLGVRFIGDLERGKQTCEIGKTLHALAMLGIGIQLAPRDQSDE